MVDAPPDEVGAPPDVAAGAELSGAVEAGTRVVAAPWADCVVLHPAAMSTAAPTDRTARRGRAGRDVLSMLMAEQRTRWLSRVVAIRSAWLAVSCGVRRIGLPVDQLPDDSLLAGFGGGDQEVTVAFVRRFQRRVYGVARTVVGDAALAEDVSQQAFERAWRHASAYDARRGSVASWLMTITRNLAIDATRLRRAQPVDPAELLLQIGARTEGADRDTLARESADELRTALSQLPPEQARALVLAGIGGLSASEVAAAERIPLGTAKTRIRTAMRRLRVDLEQSAEGQHGT